MLSIASAAHMSTMLVTRVAADQNDIATVSRETTQQSSKLIKRRTWAKLAQTSRPENKKSQSVKPDWLFNKAV